MNESEIISEKANKITATCGFMLLFSGSFMVYTFVSERWVNMGALIGAFWFLFSVFFTFYRYSELNYRKSLIFVILFLFSLFSRSLKDI